jgi:hypothetical protein
MWLNFYKQQFCEESKISVLSILAELFNLRFHKEKQIFEMMCF